jgi:hypothetical protein
MRKTPWIGAVLLAFSACGTEEIATPITTLSPTPSPDLGQVKILFAPTVDTFEEQQAWAVTFHDYYGVSVDGGQLTVAYPDGSRLAVAVYESGGTWGGYLRAGSHHFVIAPAAGGSPIFAGDVEILPGSTNTLYLFGHRDALQGRFVSYPAYPAPGWLHVSVMNLVRRGPGIEVVSCVSITCTPLSPPLAFGENFDADFATGTSRFLLADNASIGYRQLATAALPAPPVQALSSDYYAVESVSAVPSNLAVAPIYMSAQGEVIYRF